MSDSLKEREKAFEAKYHLDQEVQFRVQARRNKLFGLWIADMLGMAGGGAETYAKEMVRVNLEEVGDADILRKAMADLDEQEVDMTEGRLKMHLEKLMAQARTEVMDEVSQGKQAISHEP